MKRLISIFMILIVCFTTAPYIVNAEASDEAGEVVTYSREPMDTYEWLSGHYVSYNKKTDIEYKVTGGYIYFNKKTGTITGATENIRKVYLPEKIKGVKVRRIGPGAFNNCKKLTKMKISKFVKVIGYHAFTGCSNLKKIDNRAAIEEIGNSSCGGIYIPLKKGLKTIGRSAFCGYPGKNLILPNTLESIDETAFSGAKCKKIVIPDSVTSIGQAAFNNCSNLETLKISKKLKDIEGSAFSSCPNLKKVTVPNGVQYIGNEAFGYNKNLKKVVIAKSVTKIEKDAFRGSKKVKIYGYKGSYAEQYAKKRKIPFVIIDKDSLSKAECSLSYSYAIYTGKAKKPKATVIYKGKTLKNETDYTVSYNNNVNVGKARVKIKGKGAYKDTINKTFIIKPAAPAKVACKLVDKQYIKTTWSKVKGASGYAVYCKDSENDDYKLIKYTKDSYISKGKLKNGIKYTFKVVPYITIDKKKYFGKGKTATVNVKGIITEEDLFNKYPRNLSNKECSKIYGNIRSQVDEILYGEYDVKKDNTDRKWSLKAFKQALKNGMAGNIKAIVGAVSGKFFEEKKLEEEVALELLQGISKNSNLMGDILDETEKGYGISSKVYKIISSGYKNEKERAEFIKAVSNKTFSEKDIAATVKAVESNWDKIDKSFDGADIAINSAQVSLMVIMSMQANQNIIDELMQNIDKESILYNGLERIKDKQQKSFGRNFISEMVDEKGFDIIAGKIAAAGSGAFKPVDSCFQLLGYLIPGGDMDTTNKAVIASSNANVLDSAATELLTKLVIKSGDIEELRKSYEIIYTAKLQSINDSAQYALKVANKSQKKKLKTYYDKYKSYLSYDKYISKCLESLK